MKGNIEIAALILAAALLFTSLYEAAVLRELNEPISCTSTYLNQGHTTNPPRVYQHI